MPSEMGVQLRYGPMRMPVDEGGENVDEGEFEDGGEAAFGWQAESYSSCICC